MARPNKVESALLDASSLLGVVQGEEEFACLRPLLAAVDRGEVRLVESTAILTEVLPRHARDTELHTRARNGIRSLLESPDTQLVDVSTVVARKAGDLRAEHGLKTWDAIHLATAVLARVDVLIVRDSHFPFGDYEGVHISRPFDIDDDKLHLSRLLRCTGQPALARLSSARPSPCRNEAQRAFLTQQRAQLEDID